jgi:mono/diheme cytochrome c family protein
LLLLALLALLALVAGCDDMVDQPKQGAYSPEVGPGPVPSDTVEFESKNPGAPPLTLSLLKRGQERYHVYCAPCHSELGDGRGIIVQRGFPASASFHGDRLRRAPPGYFVDVMAQGYGIMYSFAERVQPGDRWAIAAYIKALQRSQHASLADLKQDAGARPP